MCIRDRVLSVGDISDNGIGEQRKNIFKKMLSVCFVEDLDYQVEEKDVYKSQMFRYKAFYSLDCNDGIENAAIGWAQPLPEDYLCLLYTSRCV